MLSAHDIARYFLAIQGDDDHDITNMKLQKLLYYAQGFFLVAFDGKPLFQEDIVAWQHGPVVPPVWREYRECGANAIPTPGDFDVKPFNDTVRGHLDEIWRLFGQFSAWKLRDMTHEEPPWRKHKDSQGVITHEDLIQYFRTQIEA